MLAYETPDVLEAASAAFEARTMQRPTAQAADPITGDAGLGNAPADVRQQIQQGRQEGRVETDVNVNIQGEGELTEAIAEETQVEIENQAVNETMRGGRSSGG